MKGWESAMPFTIRQLRYAVAAADHRSFHRAAKAIGVEQSNLGRHISTLERVVGVQLFTRSRAGVTPTRAGDSFLQAARRIIIQSDQMTRAARAAGQGRQGGLTLGHNSPLYMSNLRTALITWNDSHPEVEIARLEDNRQALFAGLDSGEIDIVIVTGEVAYEGIRRESLWSERVLIAMPTSGSGSV